jgi:hypothetical protein
MRTPYRKVKAASECDLDGTLQHGLRSASAHFAASATECGATPGGGTRFSHNTAHDMLSLIAPSPLHTSLLAWCRAWRLARFALVARTRPSHSTNNPGSRLNVETAIRGLPTRSRPARRRSAASQGRFVGSPLGRTMQLLDSLCRAVATLTLLTSGRLLSEPAVQSDQQ